MTNGARSQGLGFGTNLIHFFLRTCFSKTHFFHFDVLPAPPSESRQRRESEGTNGTAGSYAKFVLAVRPLKLAIEH